MKKTTIYGLIFCATVSLPIVLGLFGFRYERQSLFEKRIDFPEITSMESFFLNTKNIDEYLSYQIIYKKEFLKILARLRMFLEKSPNKNLIRGQEKWIFTNIDHRVDFNTGIKEPPFEHYKELNSFYKAIQQHFIDQGKEFYLVVAPDKHSVHSEYLPDHIKPYFMFDDMPSHVKEASDGLNFVNLFQPFREQVEHGEVLYHAHGTHWNAKGGYLAYKYTMDEIVTHRTELDIHEWQKEDFSLVNYSDFGLAKSAHLTIKDTTQSIEQTGFPCSILQDSTIAGSKSGFASRNSRRIITGASGPTLTIIGDSFTERNYKFFACSFSEILLVFQAQGRWDEKSVEAFDSDIILFEFVERYIHKEFTNIFAGR